MVNRHLNLTAVLIFAFSVIPAGVASAQSTTQPKDFNERLAWMLRSEDPLSSSKLEEVRKLAASRSPETIWPATLWVFVQKKCFVDAEQLAMGGILASKEPKFISDYQRIRARALMGQGKYSEALSAARGYYNVCPLADTTKAIDEIALCLAAARGKEDPEIVRRFKQQQNVGASTQPAADGQPIEPAKDSILLSIPLDPAPYNAAIDAQPGNGFAPLMLRGHLQLLAGQTAEARKTFDLALDVATEKQLPAAIEGLAKAIRAEAGSVGPANEFIQKLRESDK